MPSFIKNSFYCFLIVCCLSACNSDSKVIEEECQVLTDTIIRSPIATLNVAKSHTILLSGMIPPPMYANAQDIVAKIYNIKFVYAAGCVVNQVIGDSISKCNERTFADLEKHAHKDIAKEIYARLDVETTFLNRMDSVIRRDPEIKKLKKLNDQLVYYTKKDKNYLAHFIVSEPDHKVLNYKLKLVVMVDSATKAIKTSLVKDSLIKNFSDLQL